MAPAFIKQGGAVQLLFNLIDHQADLKKRFARVFRAKVYHLAYFAVQLLLAGVQVFITVFVQGEKLGRVQFIIAFAGVVYLYFLILFLVGPLRFTIADDLLLYRRFILRVK